MKKMETSTFTTTIITTILSLSLLVFPSLPSSSLAAPPAVDNKCNPQDKTALLQIKQAFNLSNPDDLSSWDSNTDCCIDSWEGVRCHHGRVISLNVFYHNALGQISPAIGNLQYLKILFIVQVTNLTGTIPSTITRLNNLNTLVISDNKLSGTIPPFLGKLKKLVELILSNTLFSGPIPSSLSQLPHLNRLLLDHNRLTGSIPESFGHLVGNAPSILLSNNFLSGPLPQSLGYVNFTLEIDLSFNNFTGDASMLFGKNKTAGYIFLNSNKFEFDLSKVEFSDNLTYLVIDHNKIFGSLPQGLTQSKNLFGIDVSHNQLCGQIPQGGKLQSFGSSAYDQMLVKND